MSTVPGADKKILAGVLAIVLPCFGGVHRFVLGDITGGLLRLLLVFACGTGLAISLVLGNMTGGLLFVFACGTGIAISLVEGIIYLTKTDGEFIEAYIDGDKAWF